MYKQKDTLTTGVLQSLLHVPGHLRSSPAQLPTAVGSCTELDKSISCPLQWF